MDIPQRERRLGTIREGQVYTVLMHDLWSFTGTLIETKHQTNGERCHVFDIPGATLPFGVTDAQIKVII